MRSKLFRALSITVNSLRGGLPVIGPIDSIRRARLERRRAVTADQLFRARERCFLALFELSIQLGSAAYVIEVIAEYLAFRTETGKTALRIIEASLFAHALGAEVEYAPQLFTPITRRLLNIAVVRDAVDVILEVNHGHVAAGANAFWARYRSDFARRFPANS